MRSSSVLLVISLLLTRTVWASQRTPDTRSQPTPSIRNVLPTKGVIEQGTYKNPSIGLEFTPAEGLHLEEPEMKGTPGAASFFISVQAFSDRTLLHGIFSPRSTLVFLADALAFYPQEQRDPARYLQKVKRANLADGYQQVGEDTPAQMSGIAFLRADFIKGEVHETVLITTHNGYALLFIFADSSIERTNKLIASTKVKLSL